MKTYTSSTETRTGARRSAFDRGQWVVVKSREEILSTLDRNGELGDLPFMPEMLDYCGKRLRVYRRAVKTCDTVNKRGMHEMRNAVFLEGARCTGEAHGGCEARCMLFWKEDWLRAADSASVPASKAAGGCTEEQLHAATMRGKDGLFYRCQATEMPRAASRHLPWWDAGQYVRDVRAGSATATQMLRSLAVMIFNKFQSFDRKFLPGNGLIKGSQHWPFLTGSARSTAAPNIEFQPGDIVRVRKREEIVGTLDSERRNRGLSFDAEMAEFCGKEFRVLSNVNQILDEKTGKMITLKDCVILDNVVCSGKHYQYCMRSIYPYWRAVWLELVRRAEAPRETHVSPEVRYVTIGQ